MSREIVNLEKKWSEETAPENNGFGTHRVIIASSKGLLNISECEYGGISFQSNEGEVILKYKNGIIEIDFLYGNKIKFADFPHEIQSVICQEALRSAKNMKGISGLVFREPENELLACDDRFEIGEDPADDIIIW